MSFISFTSYAQVKVNEICPNNVNILLDEDGDNEDWFELYNNSDSVVDITGWFISDKQNELAKWTVPNLILQAKEYLVIFASGKERKLCVNHWESILKAEDFWYLYSEIPPPGANWNQPGFDYSPWWKTAGPFGRNYPNVQTNTANAATIYISKYFSITDTSIIDYARLYMDYDDAFVAYLNGVEIARSNIGGVSWQPQHTDISFDIHESLVNQGEIPEEFKISDDALKEILIEGNNLLSIQIHNAWNNHGDCIAAPYLFLSFSDTIEHYDTVPTWLPQQNYFLHTNFKLSAEMEGLILSNPDTNIISARFFSTIKIDNSYICKNDTSMDWYITDTPTPQHSNASSTIYSAYASKVILSHAAGFYPTNIQLGINTYYPNDSIFYTLDGSEPTKNSTFYTLPISIDSTMVVRVRAYSDSLLPGPITTATYFINENKDLPVISLVTSPENLWDSLTGIYVLGSNADSIYPYDGANYWEDWERPAHIEFYDENGQEIFEQDIGIKIHGKMSRIFPMKSIRILARERYGKTHIDCQVFPSKEVYSYKRLILRNSGHDFNRTHFRDAFAHKLVQEETEIDIQDARAVVTYINGEYWGIYNLREKIDEDYIESNYNIKEDKVDILSTYLLVVNGDYDHYYKMMEYVKANSPSDSVVFDSIASMLDIDNFIDYFSAEIYSGNTDWPNNNIKYWREKSVNGKWRFIYTDLDATFGLAGYASNTLYHVLHAGIQWCENHILFRRLMLNMDFRNAYINRSADLMNTMFHPTHLNALVNQFEQERINEMPLHLSRWGSSMSFWQSNVQSMRSFSNNRANYVRNHIANEFGLTAQREIRLNMFPVNAGSIEINTIKPDTFPWNGIYFQDVPISIKAIPKPGYRFSYWLTDVGAQNYPAEFNIDLQYDAYATAYFVHDICFDTMLVVDEINYSSSDDYKTGDWFEIYNKATASMLMSFWEIKDDNDNHIFTLPHDCWIAGDEYLVVCRDTVAFKAVNPTVKNYIGNFDFGLSNTEDQVRLFDSNGKPILNILYYSQFPWPENMENSSKTIELTDVNADINIGSNWFAGCDGGSPGEAYQPCDTTSIYDITDANFNIYPNPFNKNTILYVNTEKRQRIFVKIYNSIGILIYEMNYDCFPNNTCQIPIDLSLFSKGIYLCEIEGESVQKVFNLISK